MRLPCVNGGLNIGFNAGDLGSYKLSGTGTLVFDGIGPGQGEFVGVSGTGSFEQSGGTNSILSNNLLDVGQNSGALGAYTMSDGALTSEGQEFIGDIGVGTFNQSGGVNNVSGGTLVLGNTSGGVGQYILSGGSLVSNDMEMIGNGGRGTFNQSGGSNTALGIVQIGNTNSSIGTYTLTGGTFSAVNVLVGGNQSTGVLDVESGAVVNVSGELRINTADGSGVTLNGGVLATSQFITDDVPTGFNWISGTLHLTSAVHFDSSVNLSTSDLFGSSLTLVPGQTLEVDGAEMIGGTLSFILQNNGGIDEVNGSFTVPYNSIYAQSAGSLIVAGSISMFSEPFFSGTVSSGFGQAYANDAGLLKPSILVALRGDTAFINSAGSIDFFGSVIEQGTAAGVTSFNSPGGTFLYDNSKFGTLTLVSGTLTMVGGITLTSAQEMIGDSNGGSVSFAAISQSAGINQLTNQDIYLGVNSTDVGLYALSGTGELTSVDEYVGYGGSGIFNQTGGNNVLGGIGSVLSIGLSPRSNGKYFLSGNGSLSVFFGTEYVGFEATGAFNQSGATSNVTDFLQIGFAAAGNGTYNLMGGLLSASSETIGSSLIAPGTGFFVQTGGVNQVSGAVDLGAGAGSTGSYTLAGTGLLSATTLDVGGTIGSAGGAGLLTVTNAASMSVSGTLNVWGGGRANLDNSSANVGKLIIVGKGIVNINGALNINYGSPANDPVATIVGYLQSGFNGGAWTGTAGIISTSITGGVPALSLGYADGNTDSGTAAGPNQIVVKYTLAGDANLDGLVNFNDLVAVVQNFNKAGADWAHGNFFYGASTNFNDLVQVVQNFNKTLPPPSGSASELGGTTLPLQTEIQPTVVRLPEPGLLPTIVLAGGGMLARRRRSFRRQSPLVI